MRKIIICITVVILFPFLFLCGCKKDSRVEVDVEYTTGKRPNYLGMHQVDGPYIPDAEAAISVCCAVFESQQKEGLYPGYVLKECIYYDDSQCWVLRFAPEKVLPSSELYIQIMKGTGELEMWVV